MIRGAIFDVDGTLLDSMSIWSTVGEEYLRSLGIVPIENLAQVFKTFTTEQSARYYQSHYGVTLSVPQIQAGINQLIGDFYRYRAPLKPGVPEFLAALQRRGVKMCIATATDRDLVEAALKRCKIDRFFSQIFTCTQAGAGKEKPMIYRMALAHLGTCQADTWVFEDACHAAQTAAADGFPVAALYDSSEDRQQELKDAAQIYLKTFDFALFAQALA